MHSSGNLIYYKKKPVIWPLFGNLTLEKIVDALGAGTVREIETGI